MRRLLAVLVPLVLVAACGDDDTAADTTTSVAASEVPTDSPAGDAPGEGAGYDEGLGDALLVSDLDGGSEVPGPGDPSATGRFEAELHDGVLCVDMDVSARGAPVSGAHLHDGATGEAGPVVADIGDPTSTTADLVQWVDACTEVADDVIARIAEAPERVYVNVHTTAHPDGAVRGQLAVTSVFDGTLDR